MIRTAVHYVYIGIFITNNLGHSMQDNKGPRGLELVLKFMTKVFFDKIKKSLIIKLLDLLFISLITTRSLYIKAFLIYWKLLFVLFSIDPWCN